MEARRLTIACCFAVLACALGANAASAAAPTPGGRYDGPGLKRVATKIVVSKSGARLTEFRIPTQERCSNGKRNVGYFDDRKEKSPRIDGAGAFSLTSPKEPARIRYGKGRIRATFRSSFTGTFQTPDLVTGRIHTTVKTSKYSCSGSYAFTAHRDGTPGAPFRTARLATGLYEAAGRGLKIRNLRVVGPGAEIRPNLRIKVNARCRRGVSLTTPFTLNALLLRRGLFSHGERYRSSLSGLPTRNKLRLRFHFFRRGAAYLVRGSVRNVIRVYRHKKRVALCHSTHRFTGRFVSGPA